jgi:flagellar biosynthesis/type III secretory pathway chaperone
VRVSSQNPDTIAQLRDLVQREHNLLRELVDVMASERDKLLSGSELDIILLEKRHLLETLELATQTRLKWLRAQGIPARQREMRDHLAAAGAPAALMDEIAAFEASAAQCQQCNSALSPIIQRRHHYLNRASVSLGLGIDVCEASYSHLGQSLAESGTRHLGSA